jgi:excisionase family DNA binding protein
MLHNMNRPALTPDSLLTTEDVSSILRVNLLSVRQLAKNKLRPAVRRIGRRLLFDRDTLQRLLEEGGAS